MSSAREVVILSGVRTAIGGYNGGLKDFAASDLGAMVVRESVSRAGVAPEDIGHVVFGNVIHTDVRDHYLSRVACVNGGLPVETPALTLNRLCGSGLQAILTAAHGIMLGDYDAAVGGGAEVMSHVPYWSPGMRWGARMNNTQMIDAMVGTLTDPFENIHMGITAENVAKKYGVSREDQDALAVESHSRASAAVDNGYFKDQILPVEVKVKRDIVPFDIDENVRRDTSLDRMAKLRPVFDPQGTVTAGNASSINDAAAAVVLMDAETAQKRGLKPMARLVDYAVTAVEPKYMGIGPIPAIRKVLERANMSIADMDLIELNEAFAAQALAVVRELELPMDKTNPNGSGISLGHPIGATGAILTVKAIYELQRAGGRYALISMCIGGGQGIAAILERI